MAWQTVAWSGGQRDPRRAVRREHDRTDVALRGDRRDVVGQRGEQRLRQAVARLRAVEGEDRDGVDVRVVSEHLLRERCCVGPPDNNVRARMVLFQ